MVWRWHAEDKVTLAHITRTQFFVHRRGEIGPICTTFPNQSFHKCVLRHAYLHGCTQNARYWGSALRGSLSCPPFVFCLRILTKELNTQNYYYSTELNRVDSVKMGSLLCHTITNNVYITCEWQYPVYIAPKFTQDQKKKYICRRETLLLNILYFSIVHNRPPCCQLAFYTLTKKYIINPNSTFGYFPLSSTQRYN
jgi:hypothetical protein